MLAKIDDIKMRCVFRALLAAFVLGTAVAAATANTSVVLRYFETRGRAEVIRLALEEAGLHYRQELHSPEQWPSIKSAGIESGLFPFGQVPSLSYDGFHLVQSLAILRFLGQKHGFYPSKFEEQARVEMITGASEDFKLRYGRLIYDPEFDQKKTEYLQKTLPEWLSHFNRWLVQNKGEYLVGNRLTTADLAMFDVLAAHLSLDPQCLQPFPELEAFFLRIALRPAISKYLASDRRPKFQNGASASFDNKARPGADLLEYVRDRAQSERDL